MFKHSLVHSLLLLFFTHSFILFINNLTLLDKHVFNYTLGFKSTRSNTDVVVRGAALGLLFGLPIAYYHVITNKMSPTTKERQIKLGGVASHVKYQMNNQAGRIRDYTHSRHTHRLAPPKEYVYTTDEAGRQILILDPKYGL